MKKQLLFILTSFISISSISLEATSHHETRKKTVTGKSSWTILKGVAKILVGAPLAFRGLKGLFCSLVVTGFGAITANQDRDGAAMAGFGLFGTVISSGCLVGGGYLTYSGIQDLNDEEDSEENNYHTDYQNSY